VTGPYTVERFLGVRIWRPQTLIFIDDGFGHVGRFYNRSDVQEQATQFKTVTKALRAVHQFVAPAARLKYRIVPTDGTPMPVVMLDDSA
jgi:hypothetical protein